MPEQVTQFYGLTGYASVILYSESEMAAALGVSRKKLRKLLTNGRIGLSYHGNPLNTYNHEYTFLESCFVENQERYACWLDGGHRFEFDHYADSWSRRAAWKCGCGLTIYKNV